MRQQITPGSIFKIELPCKKIAYGRILEKANYAFYNYFTDNVEKDVSRIANSDVLFIVAVVKGAITSGRWEKIAKDDIPTALQVLPMKFIQNIKNPEIIELYDTNTGKISRSSYEECLGLDAASVWEAEHVEERLCDYLAGRPNESAESLKLQKPDSVK
jgi:hypothetical protein